MPGTHWSATWASRPVRLVLARPEVAASIRTQAAYRRLSRGRLRMVLEAIENHYRGWHGNLTALGGERVTRGNTPSSTLCQGAGRPTTGRRRSSREEGSDRHCRQPDPAHQTTPVTHATPSRSRRSAAHQPTLPVGSAFCAPPRLGSKGCLVSRDADRCRWSMLRSGLLRSGLGAHGGMCRSFTAVMTCSRPDAGSAPRVHVHALGVPWASHAACISRSGRSASPALP